MDLGEYLRDAAATPWADGAHDCTAWPARWAGIDLPADYALGDRKLVDAWAEWIGDRLARVDAPQAGDVGVVECIGEDGPSQIGGIFTGRRWAFLTPRGLACVSIAPDHIKGIWRG